jgi:hypothetical protein
MQIKFFKYKGADESLARPTSRCILFDGENISFDASEPAGLGLAQGPLLCGSSSMFENIRHGEIPFTFLSLYGYLLVIG